jgi:DNA-binding Xre family transcriptional regulator
MTFKDPEKDRTPMDKMLAAQGISRLELARRSGVPARTIEDWAMRKTKSPNVYQLLKVSKILGCTIEDLLEPERNGIEPAAEKKKSPEG